MMSESRVGVFRAGCWARSSETMNGIVRGRGGEWASMCRPHSSPLGSIADIFQIRGQLDEALQIRKDDELPVYQRLGDIRLRAIALGKIADILHARGNIDEALRIRQHEELPVYERLG